MSPDKTISPSIKFPAEHYPGSTSWKHLLGSGLEVEAVDFREVISRPGEEPRHLPMVIFSEV